MGLFDRLKQGLRKTRDRLGDSLNAVVGRRLEGEARDDIEAALLGADLGPALVEDLLRGLASGDGLRLKLAQRIETVLQEAQPAGAAAWIDQPPAEKPQVILLSGVNGAGKTTTSGKLAARWAGKGEKVMLAAGDTFRAAAREQLEQWAQRANVEFFAQKEGADPAAVAFDAIEKAVASDVDRLVIDTAGRLQAKEGLMRELEKIHRVCAKALPGAPHQGLLVLDGTAGQNMLSQAREFHKSVQPTGLVITKLDGTARAGAVVSVVREVGIPVHLIGVGETLEDLQEFKPGDFARALVGAE